MGVEQSALDRRGDGDELAWRPLPDLPVDFGGERVGIGARSRDHATSRLGGERGPQEVFRVEVGTPVLGGIGRCDGDELPCGTAQQTAEVDAPRVGRFSTLSGAEKVREEVSEGSDRSRDPAGRRSWLSVPVARPDRATLSRCTYSRSDAVPQVRRDHRRPQPHLP